VTVGRVNRHYVAVVGPHDVGISDPIYVEAYRVGRFLTREGMVVICGGLAGVMEAASRGVNDEVGTTIGLLPDSDAETANEYLTYALPTGLGELRNWLVVSSSAAVVSVGGSWGTMSEIAMAVRLGKPVVSLRGWSVVDELGMTPDGIAHCQDAETATQEIVRLVRGDDR
jgi:uncharacterized protein (TIGR00725 family)